MQDFSSFFFPQILNSHFISVYLHPKKAHDNNTYHIGYYGSLIHLGQGEGRHRGAYRPGCTSGSGYPDACRGAGGSLRPSSS